MRKGRSAMQVTVADMMAAREARAQMQQTLLAGNPGAVLVCLTMNVAGPVKTDAQIERAFAWGRAGIEAVLAPQRRLFAAEIHEATGPEAVLVVEGDAGEIKRRLCALEDGCAMGRLLDVDVLFGQGGKVSRGDVGLPPRRCLICGEPAAVCARSRAHSAQELFARTQEIIRTHFEDAFARHVAEQAERALLTEAALAPKPGLVDRLNPGAHRDMDLFTFIDSACALRPYFEACAREGLARRTQALREEQSALHLRMARNGETLARMEAGLVEAQQRRERSRLLASLAMTANGQLSGRDKVTLETFVQMTYFDRVLRRANRRLLQMTDGQYELRRLRVADNQRSQSGLDMEVVDHVNGSSRSVRTLSGGETFKASLALALGLSDEIQENAGGVGLDTLFVDEGFGSLDSQSLTQAIAVLAELTQGRRLVGIISHVEELGRRIDRQLVVTKDRAGESHVRVVTG